MDLAMISIITSVAVNMGFEPELALAIAKTESQLNPVAVGQIGEIGLMQVRPEFSKIDRKYLFNPHVNAYEGIRILKEYKRQCRHHCEGLMWVISYNMGPTGAKKVTNPETNSYYLKVKEAYDEALLQMRTRNKYFLKVQEEYDTIKSKLVMN